MAIIIYFMFLQVLAQPTATLTPLINKNTVDIANRAICIVFPIVLKLIRCYI